MRRDDALQACDAGGGQVTEPKDVMIPGRPIEITEDSFSVMLGSGLRVPRDSASGIPPRDSWHMAKDAADLADDAVPADHVEALQWLRAKRGRIDFGKAYSHQDPYGIRVQVPERPVTIQFPYFGVKYRANIIETSGATLSEAVAQAVLALFEQPQEDTYPGRDTGLDRVLAVVGDAVVRVSDLLALIRDYYRVNSTGGSLHSELDDQNLEDRHVDHGIRYAREQKDGAAVLIGTLLRLMPEAERLRLRERGYGR